MVGKREGVRGKVRCGRGEEAGERKGCGRGEEAVGSLVVVLFVFDKCSHEGGGRMSPDYLWIAWG